MVNNKFRSSQTQRWALLIAIAMVCVSGTNVWAQEPYYNNSYKIYSNQQSSRVAQLNAPVQPRINPQPFQVDVVSPPNPFPDASGNNNNVARNRPAAQSPRLAKAFGTKSRRTAAPSSRLQDVFGENPQGDIFGEQPPSQADTAPINPFEKVEANPPTTQQKQLPSNPFGEIAPREDTSQRQQAPVPQNPFGELADPTPTLPPMDTRPVVPQSNQVEPQLPPGSEFTPDPGQIDRNPPIPGEDPVVRPQDDSTGEEMPDLTGSEDPGEITSEPEESVFDSKEEPDNSDVPPVPAPRSSKVYLPARDPLDYVQPSGAGAIPRGYDPRMMQNNPYANLPGPYGYPAQAPYNGYGMPPYPGPYPNPYMAPPAMPYGQCGPGCMPSDQCNSCNSCNGPASLLASNNCGGCNSGCGSSRPTLAGTDIGERIVQTTDVELACDDTYVEVVNDCDNLCSNFASCYVGVFGGWSDLNDFTTRGEIGTGIYFEDAGYLFGFTLGQIQGRNLRTELELSYRNINVNGLRLDGQVPSEFVGVYGDFGTFAGMLNGYWEFVDFNIQKIKPYVGAGVGFAMARPNLIQSNGLEAAVDSDESSFAWQWMVGLNYKASPTLDAFIEYRNFSANSFRLDTEIPSIAGLGDGSGPFDYRSSNVLFGLRARF